MKINKEWVDVMQEVMKYQTPIDNKRKELLIKEFNEIIDAFEDDIQTLYVELQRYITNKFLNGHMLVDGNKRMHRMLTTRILHFIKNDDIL